MPVIAIVVKNDQCHAREVPNPPHGTMLIRDPLTVVYLDNVETNTTIAKLYNPPDEFFDELDRFFENYNPIDFHEFHGSPCPHIITEIYRVSEKRLKTLINIFKKYSS